MTGFARTSNTYRNHNTQLKACACIILANLSSVSASLDGMLSNFPLVHTHVLTCNVLPAELLGRLNVLLKAMWTGGTRDLNCHLLLSTALPAEPQLLKDSRRGRWSHRSVTAYNKHTQAQAHSTSQYTRRASSTLDLHFPLL